MKKKITRTRTKKKHARTHNHKGGSSIEQKGFAAQVRSALRYVDPHLYKELCEIVHSGDLSENKKSNVFHDTLNHYDEKVQHLLLDAIHKIMMNPNIADRKKQEILNGVDSIMNKQSHTTPKYVNTLMTASKSYLHQEDIMPKSKSKTSKRSRHH
jgi:hypothetical protein